MKKIQLKMGVVFLIMNTVCYAQTENIIVFKEPKMNVSWKLYIELKDALVESKLSESKAAALAFENSLSDIKEAKEAMGFAGQIGRAATIEDQRKSSSELNNSMESLSAKGRLTSGTIYLDYCPMANDNEGAYWYSSEKVISNPYFGDMMLRCGAVKETIQ
jgi:hypothetical protein